VLVQNVTPADCETLWTANYTVIGLQMAQFVSY
jgi:hypothetical protein